MLVPWIRDVLHKSRSAAPGWQGAKSAHIGHMQAMSNAARRDAPPGNYVRHQGSRGLGHRRPALVGPRPRVAENFGLVQREYPAIAHQDAAVHDGRADIAAARHVHEM